MSGTVSRHAATAIAIVASIAVVVASCSPAASAPPTSSPAASPALPASSTQPASPVPSPTQAAAAPVTPTSDRAVVRLELGASETGSMVALILYDDGSLVDLRSWPPSVRALTTAGRDLVVARLRDSGVFTKSHAIPAIPIASGFGLYAVTLVVDGTPIRVNGTNVRCDSDSVPADCHEDPETPVMLALVDGLVDVAAWLPLSAFRDGDARAHPYLAARARVTSERIALQPNSWTNPEQSLSLVDWPVGTQPSELGQPVELAGQPNRTLRCELIDGGQERAIRAALAPLSAGEATTEPGGTENDLRTTIWDVWLAGEPALLRLTLRPYLPDETAGCNESELPAAPTLAGAPRPSLAAVLAASAGGISPVPPTAFLYASVYSTADATHVAEVSYYANGVVLFRDPSPPAVGIGALRLTPTGLDLVRRALDDLGLLASDYDESIPEGAVYAHMTTILTPDVVLNASDRGRYAKATAIAKLAGKLADPASWLPATAWMTDPGRLLPFLPASVELRIEPRAGPGYSALPSVSALKWPLSGSLQTIGGADDSTVPGARLATLSTEDAVALIAALEATGARGWGSPTRIEYLLASDASGGAVSISLWVEINERAR